MKSTPLSQRTIFWLWFPLAATWLMMSVENPLIQGATNRLPEAKLNLAALGVAGPITLFIVSPVFSLISASNTLVKDRLSYYRLLCFTCILSGILSICTALIALPAVFSQIAERLLHLQGDLVEVSRFAVLMYFPAPIAVAYRRFYQGILIKAQRNHQVGQATILRFLALICSLFLFSQFTNLPSAQICIASLVIGFIGEAVLVRWMARHLVRDLVAQHGGNSGQLTYGRIAHFYLPLGLTSLVFTASQPIYAFFLAQGPYPIESLAVFPVIYNFNFLFGCLIFAMQELAISRIGEGEADYRTLNKFLRTLTAVVLLGQAAVVLTPLARLVFIRLYGLSDQLFALMIKPIWLILPLQIYLAIGVWQRAVLIQDARTKSITLSTVIDVLSSAVSIYLLLRYTALSGITSAVIALFVGRTVNTLSLIPFFENARKHRLAGPCQPLLPLTEEDLSAGILT